MKTSQLTDDQRAILIDALCIAHNDAEAQAMKETDPELIAVLRREAEDFASMLEVVGGDQPETKLTDLQASLKRVIRERDKMKPVVATSRAWRKQIQYPSDVQDQEAYFPAEERAWIAAVDALDES